MPIRKLVSLGLAKDLPRAKATLRKADGQRLACVRGLGGQIDVLEDRCPHEGHPLSMGLVRDGVLTCPWHNWKFDLATGDCLFGGESATRFDTEIIDGEAFVELAEQRAARGARRARDLVRAIEAGRCEVALREALRLAAEDADAPFRLVLEHALRKSRFGCSDSIATVAAARYLVREAGLPLASALMTLLAERIAERTVAHSGNEAEFKHAETPDLHAASLADRDQFLDALLEERRSEAAARVEALPAATEFGAIYTQWFAPFLTLKLWDRGTAYVRAQSLRELMSTGLMETSAARPHAAAESLAAMLAWAVAETDLPGWKPTRVALVEVARMVVGTAKLQNDVGYTDAVLRGERDAVDATVLALGRGVAPLHLRDVLAVAALERLARFDAAWTQREDSRITVVDAARPLVFAAATLAETAPEALKPAVVMLAGLLGRTARISVASAIPSAELTAAVDGTEAPLRSMYCAMATSAPLPEETVGARLVLAAAAARVVASAVARDPWQQAELERLLARCTQVVLDCRRTAPQQRLALLAQGFLATGLPPEGLD